MLTITVKESECFDEKTQTFIYVPETQLQLEHSLIAISKWEQHFHKPYLSKESKSRYEILYYIKCMTINKNVPKEVYFCLSNENIEAIAKYIEDSATATTFSNDNRKGNSGSFITSELIYYWMTIYNIPFTECQKWNLNRLLVLIKICNVKSQPEKKMSRNEVLRQHASLNKMRRSKH